MTEPAYVTDRRSGRLADRILRALTLASPGGLTTVELQKMIPGFTLDGLTRCAVRLHMDGQIERELRFNRFGPAPQYSVWRAK